MGFAKSGAAIIISLLAFFEDFINLCNNGLLPTKISMSGRSTSSRFS